MTVYIGNMEEITITKDKVINRHQSEETGVTDPDPDIDGEEDNDPIDIPGLKNIWDSKYTLIGKFVWLVILITCTTLMLIHVISRVRYYLSLPVSVGIYIENNATMYYPDITLCHTEFWRKDLYAEVINEIANIDRKNASDISMNDILMHMTIMELWNRVAFRIDDLVLHCVVESTKPCTEVGNWRPQFTVLGICYTLTMTKPFNVSGNFYGMRLSLNTTAKSSSWKILIHDHEDTPKLKLFTEGISVSSLFITDVRMSLTQFRLKATNERSCSDIKMSACKEKCLSDYTLQTLHCKLPFMEDVDAPYCAPPIHAVADKTVNTLLLNRNPNCTCPQECNSDQYDTNVDGTYFSESNGMQVRIYYEDFVYTVIKEEFSYSAVALISDIGGTLGLFLGFSILTIVELIAALIIKVKKRYNKRKAARCNSITNKPST